MKHDFKKNMWSRNDPQHLINLKNEYGQTPLYVACKHGNLHIVKVLIEEGANPFIKSKIDNTLEENIL